MATIKGKIRGKLYGAIAANAADDLAHLYRTSTLSGDAFRHEYGIEKKTLARAYQRARKTHSITRAYVKLAAQYRRYTRGGSDVVPNYKKIRKIEKPRAAYDIFRSPLIYWGEKTHNAGRIGIIQWSPIEPPSDVNPYLHGRTLHNVATEVLSGAMPLGYCVAFVMRSNFDPWHIARIMDGAPELVAGQIDKMIELYCEEHDLDATIALESVYQPISPARAMTLRGMPRSAKQEACYLADPDDDDSGEE